MIENSMGESLKAARDSAPKHAAAMFIAGLKRKNDEKRIKTARELYKFIHTEIKDESSQYVTEFISCFDSRESSQVIDWINSQDMDEKKAGCYLMAILLDVTSIGESSRVIRYANALIKAFNTANMDETTIEIFARTLSYIVQLSKVGELVNKCLDQAFEWLEEPERHEKRRLAACYLMRELALFAPTQFFIKAPEFFDNIFKVFSDPKPNVRLCAVSALHAALTITSQREMKDKLTCYTKCYQTAIHNADLELSRDDRWHSSLLVLNELVKISDERYERERMLALGLRVTTVVGAFGTAVDWLTSNRMVNIVESKTAKALVTDHINTILDFCLNARNSRVPYVQTLLLEIFPRICSIGKYKDPDVKNKLLFEYVLSLARTDKEKHLKDAIPSAGLLFLLEPREFYHFVPLITMTISEHMQQAQTKKRAVDPSIYLFLQLLVRAYKTDVNKQIRELLPLVLGAGLNHGTCGVLMSMLQAVPEMKAEIEEQLVDQISLILVGKPINKKSVTARLTVPSTPIEVTNPELVCLALEAIDQFEFSRHNLVLFLEYICDTYMHCDFMDVRIASVKCVASNIMPFVDVHEVAHQIHKQSLQDLIYSVLSKLVCVGIVDPKPEVRLCVMKALTNVHPMVHRALASPKMMDMLFMALHDEKPKVQLGAVSLMGKICDKNPSLVQPRLRRALLEALSQLTTSGNERLEQHSARLIDQLTQQQPDFMRPYTGPVAKALLPKLRSDPKYADVTVDVLNALSELAVVGGVELVRILTPTFNELVHYVADGGNARRRSAALRTMVNLCRSTAYVVDPYKDYPNLLDELMRLIKTESAGSIRQQVMEVLGVLGALDPFTHKVFRGDVQSAFTISTALSMPSTRDKSDPRQDIIQWFNYEKCTLDEFYPMITIANLMLMIENDAFSSVYDKIIEAVLKIAQTQDDTKITFVDQVMPRLIEVTRFTRSVAHRKFFLTQIANFVSIVKMGASEHIKDILRLIAEIWSSEDASMKKSIVEALEQMGTALGSNFSTYVPEMIPYLLKVAQTDRTHDRTLTLKVLSCVRAISGCLTPHLHLILPPVLSIADDNSIQMHVREEALEAVCHLGKYERLNEYSPRIMQVWFRNIHLQPLQPVLLKVLVTTVKQMWPMHFNVFKRNVDATLAKYGLESAEYKELNKQATAHMLRHVDRTDGTPNPHFWTKRTAEMIFGAKKSTVDAPRRLPESRYVRQRGVEENVRPAWQIKNLVSREDWTQWLSNFRLTCIRHSSSPAIRVVASLAEEHGHLAKDLFNAAFMSVWTELSERAQTEVTHALQAALTQCSHQEIVQSILSLAEFMDHSEKGPLPVSYEVMARSAQTTKAYAKALRYKEIEIIRQLRNSNEMPGADDNPYLTACCNFLISFANKLNVPDEAAGVIKYVESRLQKNRQISVQPKGEWYEPLNQWEKALAVYSKIGVGQVTDDVRHREMRCLEALGRWKDVFDKSMENYTLAKENEKVAVIAARSAWALSDWDQMREFSEMVNINTHDGAFLRAVLAVKKDEPQAAMNLIRKCRDMYDSELTAMASESYERAYSGVVLLQQLAELEECIEYKLRKERRPRLMLLWARRLMGCRQDVEDWQRFLMLRELVMRPVDLQPMKVKFASLCRNHQQHELARLTLKQLLDLDPREELFKAKAPQDKPLLTLALCKQLWVDGHHNAAVNTLEALSRHMHHVVTSQSMMPTQQLQEKKRIAAKIFVKLGEWCADPREQHKASFPGGDSAYKMSYSHSTESPALLEMQAHQAMSRSMTTHVQAAAMNERHNLTKQVIACFKRATEFDKTWHKPWHRLATTYYGAMQRERELMAVRQQQPMMMQPPRQLAPVLPGYQAAPPPLFNPPALSQHLPGTMPQPQPAMVQPNLSFVYAQQQRFEPYIGYAREAVTCFIEALKLTQGSRLEDTIRLLALLYELSDGHISPDIRNGLKKLPPEMWLEVVPQLIARLDSNDSMAILVKQIILDVSKMYPHAMVYALTVASKSPNEKRSRNAHELWELFTEMSPKHLVLAEQARLVTDELVRCAILWHEQWNEGLDEASKLYFQDRNVHGMLAVLDPLHKMIEAGANTIKEHSFNQTYFADLQDARKFCQAYVKSKQVKELSQAWEVYYAVFKRIQTQLRQVTSLDLTYVSPKLKAARDLEISIPGTYDPTGELVTISWFDTHLQVISSKQRPRRMTLRGSNGKEYQFLLKGHEDPRQDERVMQLFGLVNNLLVTNSDTCRLNLTIQRYSIVALSQNSGLIGWVPNCDTLHALVREYRDKKKIPLSLEHKEMQQHAGDLEQLTIMQKVQLFELALQKTRGDDLQEILWLKSPSSEVWFDRRTNYTRSMGVMSMVGYMLGLGDRHPSNLMLDRLTGKIVHIDFGDCFEVAMLREKYPEKIPFRLTRMLVNAMEVTGIEGNYRHTCERVLRLLRTNKESLLAVLEAFVYDPLINWRLLAVNRTHNPGEKRDVSKMKRDEALPDSDSRKIVDRIKDKLTGTDFDDVEVELDVSEQLTRLVDQATSCYNLCQCYIGWCPFW